MERNSSLDFLRIIAMWFVLTAHFLGWGGAVNTLTFGDINYYWVMPIYFISQIGNTLFFMLAGYFAKQPRIEKIIALERKTAFYSTVITWIVFAFGGVSLSYAIHAMFPLISKKYWFISVYLVLYCLELFLVPGLKKLNYKEFVFVMVALLLNNTLNDNPNFTIMQGLMAFLIGFFIRAHNPLSSQKKGRIIFFYIITIIIYTLERFMAKCFHVEHGRFDTISRYTLLLLSAFFLFCFFKKQSIIWRWPVKVSTYIVSVYLITANPAITELLYTRLLQIEIISNKIWFLCYYLIVNVFLMVFCIVVDIAVSRIICTETMFYFRILDKLGQRNSKYERK